MARSLAILTLLTFVLILSPRHAPSAQRDTVTIVNSGSTNRPGFRIVIDRSGVAEYTEVSRGVAPQAEKNKAVKLTIPRALTFRLFTDLTDATPLAVLPVPHCMKSVSFGSTLTIAQGTEQSPDLSCGNGGNPVVASLIRDCSDIAVVFQKQ